MPVWLQQALREGGLFAVAVISLSVSAVFYRMWGKERDYNRDAAAENQRQALRMSETVIKMADAVERQADAIESLADQEQRTREEDMRERLERK